MMSSTSITHKITYNNMVPFKIDHQTAQVSYDDLEITLPGIIEYATCTSDYIKAPSTVDKYIQGRQLPPKWKENKR